MSNTEDQAHIAGKGLSRTTKIVIGCISATVIGVLLCACILGTAEVLAQVYLALSTQEPDRALAPTDTPQPTDTPTFTATPTQTPSPTPTFTNTPLPASDTPIPTETPIPSTNTPAPPTDTPTPLPPTDTPTPTVDFVVTKQRMLSMEENAGCVGNHSIYVTVIDVQGNPIDGLIVGDTWNNVELVTGSKGPGQAYFDLWKNTMEIIVKRDQTGREYRSEKTRPLSSIHPEISDMIAGGYCKDEADCQQRIATGQYCVGHFSYEVVIQRTW
ncbi:MAG: hypothetical protein ACUVV0_14635 [Anaerolineae bacterium]